MNTTPEPIAIDIVSDTVCPWCYVGKRRFERALSASGAEVVVRWHPYQLDPTIPLEGVDAGQHLASKFGGRDRLAAFTKHLTEVGRGEDIAFAFDRIARRPNSLASHCLIRWAGEAGCQDAVVEGLFRAYFEEARDIGDAGVLATVAGAAGMDAEAVLSWLDEDRDRDVVTAEADAYRRAGVTGVPDFVIGGQFRLVGAQEPSMFQRAFDRLRQ